MTPSRTMIQPTPEQEAIIASVASGDHTIVEALAGCAKTTTLELCAAALPKNKAALFLAFNVKIKKELETRLKGSPSCKVQTLNGLGHGVLLKAGLRPNIDNDKIFKLTKDLGLRKDDLADTMFLARAGRLAGIIPKGKVGKGLRPDSDEEWQALAEEEDISLDLVSAARQVFYQSFDLALSGTIDYDDQVYLSALVYGAFPRSDLVFVDEAQDLSPLNHLQIRKAAGLRGQVVAVGDSHQAIYAWRGADHQSMQNLRELRPTWTDRTLSVTFRCPQSVVERQWSLVPNFRAGPDNPEGEVQELRNWTPSPGSAILCRNNAPIIRLAFRLLRRGIPAQVLGTDIGKSLKRLYNKLSNHGAKPMADVIESAKQQIQVDPRKNADKYGSLIALLESGIGIDAALAKLATKGEGVALATIHRAKGLEWPTVYHLEPDLIPSIYATTQAELQQEENLRYVAETRTKNSLYLVRQSGLR